MAGSTLCPSGSTSYRVAKGYEMGNWDMQPLPTCNGYYTLEEISAGKKSKNQMALVGEGYS